MKPHGFTRGPHWPLVNHSFDIPLTHIIQKLTAGTKKVPIVKFKGLSLTSMSLFLSPVTLCELVLRIVDDMMVVLLSLSVLTFCFPLFLSL